MQFCVTSGIFAGRAQQDPAKSHENNTFPNWLHKYVAIITLQFNFTFLKCESSFAYRGFCSTI
jgi:hypothetical protein